MSRIKHAEIGIVGNTGVTTMSQSEKHSIVTNTVMGGESVPGNFPFPKWRSHYSYRGIYRLEICHTIHSPHLMITKRLFGATSRLLMRNDTS